MVILVYAVIFISIGYALNRYIENKTVVFTLFASITVLWAFVMGPWAIAAIIELIVGYSLVDKPKNASEPVGNFKLSDIPNGLKSSVVTHFEEAAKENKISRESDAGINMFLSALGFFGCLYMVNNFDDDQASAFFRALGLLCVTVFTVFSFVSFGKENVFTKGFFLIWDTIRYVIAIGLIGLLIYAFASK